MPVVVRKLRVKEDYITLLNAISHKDAGEIADNLGVKPPVVRTHIRDNTPTLLRVDWQNEIRRVLDIDKWTDLTEEIPETEVEE